MATNKKYTIAKSFGYAFTGLKDSYRENTNLRIHVAIAPIALFIGVIVGLSAIELVLVVLTIVLVISMEMMNTVVEEVVNLIAKDYRQEAKIAKDVAAGMVLVSAMGAVMVVLLLYLPHLFYLFR